MSDPIQDFLSKSIKTEINNGVKSRQLLQRWVEAAARVDDPEFDGITQETLLFIVECWGEQRRATAEAESIMPEILRRAGRQP